MTIDNEMAAKQLWAYSPLTPSARACLLSVTAGFSGHEVFYIVAADTTADAPSRELAARFYPEVPVRGDLSGRNSFFSTAKAGRLLGWRCEA